MVEIGSQEFTKKAKIVTSKAGKTGAEDVNLHSFFEKNHRDYCFFHKTVV